MSERYQVEAARRSRERRHGIGRVVILWALTLLLGDLLCSLLVPFVGLLQIALLKNLLYPPPYVTAPVSITTSVWGGNAYIPDDNHDTGAFDLHSGKLRFTIPEFVVGSDERFLYTNTGMRFVSTPSEARGIYYWTKLTARDSSGRAVWSYDNTPFELSSAQEYGSYSYLLPRTQLNWKPQIQSDANSVYLLGTRVYVDGTSTLHMSRVVALNKATGAMRWSYDLTPEARFVLARGALILLTQEEQPRLIALSIRDGRQLWRQPINSSALFVTDGRLLYLLISQELRALSAQTGAQMWAMRYLQSPGQGAPLFFIGSVIYLHNSVNQITAINASDGRQLWRVTSKTATSPLIPLAARDGILYTWQSGPSNVLSAVDGANGRVLWTWMTPIWTSLPTIVGAFGAAIYLVHLTDYTGCENINANCGEIFAVNAQTGALVWSRDWSQWSESFSLVGQSLLIASQAQRYQVPTPLIAFRGPTIHTNCTYRTTLTSLSVTTDAVAWNHMTTRSCPSGG